MTEAHPYLEVREDIPNADFLVPYPGILLFSQLCLMPISMHGFPPQAETIYPLPPTDSVEVRSLPAVESCTLAAAQNTHSPADEHEILDTHQCVIWHVMDPLFLGSIRVDCLRCSE